MSRFHDLPFGYVESTGDNEVKIVSLKQDPPVVRLVVREDVLESNLGGVSYGIERHDGSGVDDQMALIQGRLTANRQSGGVYIALAKARGQAVEEVLYIDPTIALFQVPVVAPNLSGGGEGTGNGQRLESATGQFVYQLQDDAAWQPYGAIIVYDSRLVPGKLTAVAKLVPVKL